MHTVWNKGDEVMHSLHICAKCNSELTYVDLLKLKSFPQISKLQIKSKKNLVNSDQKKLKVA